MSKYVMAFALMQGKQLNPIVSVKSINQFMKSKKLCSYHITNRLHLFVMLFL